MACSSSRRACSFVAKAKAKGASRAASKVPPTVEDEGEDEEEEGDAVEEEEDAVEEEEVTPPKNKAKGKGFLGAISEKLIGKRKNTERSPEDQEAPPASSSRLSAVCVGFFAHQVPLLTCLLVWFSHQSSLSPLSPFL